MEKSAKSIWDNILTKKYLYLQKMIPIIDIKSSFTLNPRIKNQFKEYDPLAIALKMIEIVIDNMGAHTGITKEDMFTQIIPLLQIIDKIHEISLNKSDHLTILEIIYEKLVYQHKKEGIKIEYTDYAANPPVKRVNSFRLITTRIYDGETIVLYAEPEAVNFFLQILDINLEDQQVANETILKRQLERGDFQSALETAEYNLRLTKMYELKILDIIKQTNRNIKELDWKEKIPKELEFAELHIKDCIDGQLKLLANIRAQINNEWHQTDIKMQTLIPLRDSLRNSIDRLLPLQKLISDAREDFIREHLIQEISRKKTNRIMIEDELFSKFLTINVVELDNNLDDLTPFFFQIDPVKIITYDQILEHSLKKNQLNVIYDESKPENKLKKIELIDLEIFSDELISKTVEILNEKLESKRICILSELLDEFIKNEESFLCINFLRLLIQCRYSVKDSQQKYLNKNITVNSMKTSFSNVYFEGNDYEITISQNNEE